MSFIPELGRFYILQQALVLACFSWVLFFLVNLYKARSRIIKLKIQGLCMPPHHPIFGHLLVAKEFLSKIPRDAHRQYLPSLIRQAMPQVGPVFYLDMWPISVPLLVVTSPSVAHQFTQEHSLPKSDGLRRVLRPLAQNQDLVSLEGPAWKKWRNVFNPGFSASHLILLTPQITNEVSTFCEIMRERAKAGDMFLLKEATVNLTMDTIGRVVLDTHFNAQRSRNEFVSALGTQIRWLSFGAEINPFNRWNPCRPLVHWYCSRIMDRYMARELDRCFSAYEKSAGTKGQKHGRPKPVVDLALDEYLKENPGSEAVHGMDPTFKKFAISQMKVFILAGHDTTSSTLCYVCYLLSKNPLALQKVRAEHDNVFGSDLSQTHAKIAANPQALNQIPFTVAVIKESMRLFPSASSTRKGEAGFYLEEEGLRYPTEGFIVWSLHQAIHRNPLYWSQPDTFIPERWIVPNGDPLYPIKGAWRPFEFGPRNCIGQELAMLEIKIFMVMTLREFNIAPSYKEWDRIRGKPEPKTVNGERAYQVLDGTTRPADGFPCRVTIASSRQS